jgi:hypothetical protein
MAGRLIEVFPSAPEGRAALLTVSLALESWGMERARKLVARADQLA